MSTPLTIFIASSSLDHHTYDPVVEHIVSSGHEVIVYETDKVITGSIKSELSVDKSGTITIRYGNRVITNEKVDAAWFRRPSLFVYDRDDRAERMSLEENARSAFEMTWDAIETHKWLNSPDNILRAQRKILQFSEAQLAGLILPGTVLTNSWDTVRSIGEKSVMKVPGSAFLHSDANTKVLFTTVLDHAKIRSISHTQPFPGIFEPYIPKRREWRITIVGEQVFPVAIYTKPDAKDDWRRHQRTSGVEFKYEPLNDRGLVAKCYDLMYRLGLRYGAFDFIETPDGEMVFLEVNPNGQYGWLEKTLGIPISKAIADELIKIGLAGR